MCFFAYLFIIHWSANLFINFQFAFLSVQATLQNMMDTMPQGSASIFCYSIKQQASELVMKVVDMSLSTTADVCALKIAVENSFQWMFMSRLCSKVMITHTLLETSQDNL